MDGSHHFRVFGFDVFIVGVAFGMVFDEDGPSFFAAVFGDEPSTKITVS